ncbi:hypothetical protein B0H14DRAFT_2655401, partial [Mycena olivaceomarginata]
MDPRSQSDPEFGESTLNATDSALYAFVAASTAVLTSMDPTVLRYTGAFFPHATEFAINGGVFTSRVTNIYPPPQEQPAGQLAFQTVLLGDVKLMKEIRFSRRFGVVDRQSRGGTVRQ